MPRKVTEIQRSATPFCPFARLVLQERWKEYLRMKLSIPINNREGDSSRNGSCNRIGNSVHFDAFRRMLERSEKLNLASYLIKNQSVVIRFEFFPKVPETGLEPAHLSILDPKSSASTNSAIPAHAVEITGMGARGKHTLQRGGFGL